MVSLMIRPGYKSLFCFVFFVLSSNVSNERTDAVSPIQRCCFLCDEHTSAFHTPAAAGVVLHCTLPGSYELLLTLYCRTDSRYACVWMCACVDMCVFQRCWLICKRLCAIVFISKSSCLINSVLNHSVLLRGCNCSLFSLSIHHLVFKMSENSEEMPITSTKRPRWHFQIAFPNVKSFTLQWIAENPNVSQGETRKILDIFSLINTLFDIHVLGNRFFFLPFLPGDWKEKHRCFCHVSAVKM